MNARFLRDQLDRRLLTEAPDLSRRVVGTFLGRHFDRVDAFHHQIGETRIFVGDGGRYWHITRKFGREEGTGVLGLIACLFEVSPGMAARLIIEAAANARLPPETASAMQLAIDYGGLGQGVVMTR